MGIKGQNLKQSKFLWKGKKVNVLYLGRNSIRPGKNILGLVLFIPVKIYLYSKDSTINLALEWVHENKLTEYNKVPEESSIYSVGNLFCGSKHLGILSHLGEAKKRHELCSVKQKGCWINLPPRDYRVVDSLLILECLISRFIEQS